LKKAAVDAVVQATMESADRAEQSAGGLESAKAILNDKIEELERIHEGTAAVAAVAPKTEGLVIFGPSDRMVVQFPNNRGEIVVVVGTSKDAAIPGMIDNICRIVHSAYSGANKHKRMERSDAVQRLRMGDDGLDANRVLHLAYKDKVLVGCASSTFQPGWTEGGCGHWGLLAVDPQAQGGGVATALVLAAERRLATACERIQIEYECTEGEEFSQRLFDWYEGKLGFDGGRRGKTGSRSFRCCQKRIPEEAQRLGQRRRLEDVQAWLSFQLAGLETSTAVLEAH
jgi:ribosomal protein S18 acetylase RimI-like enzyme